jgi:hypothetical protein
MESQLTEFRLFGVKSRKLIQRWRANPIGWFGNATGLCFANIGQSWSRGIYRLQRCDKYNPFWNAFQDHYYHDPQTEEDLRGQFPANYDKFSAWYPNTPQTLRYWETMTPYIRKTLFPLIEEYAEEKLAVDIPVLHFRAGDIPFGRHSVYHFPRYHFYQWCQEHAPQYDNWLIVTNYKAMTNRQDLAELSRKYLQDVRAFLYARGIRTDVCHDRTEFEDCYTMLSAPYLFTSMLSSFSYFIGLSKPAGSFLSARSRSCNANPAWMYNRPGLPHGQVDDYFDLPAVLRQLRG